MYNLYEVTFMIKVYNKLVRDKIPEIIANDGESVMEIKTLGNEDYLLSLNNKLQEELNEYLESGSVEELADIEEVLRALLNVKNVSYDEFELIRKAKVEKRGAFDKKIYLVSVGEKNNFDATQVEIVANSAHRLFKDAVKLIAEEQQLSVSFLQRRLSIGYSAAAGIVDNILECGFAAKDEENKKYVVLITTDEYIELFEN